MASSRVSTGAGDHHVLAVPGWFGSVRGWGSLPDFRVFFPDAELEVLPNAGHYPMFETPVALATSIEEFLGRD
jgi:hypothetical protein